MRVRPIRVVISALLGGALLSACAGGGSSVRQSAGAIPSAVQRGTVADVQDPFGSRAPSAVRRTLNVPSCSTAGTGAFVGGGSSNVAGGVDSFIGGGLGNEACDEYSAVAGGQSNAISGGPNANQDDFIGGGYSNTMTGADGFSTIAGGYGNSVSSLYATIAGGLGNSAPGAGGSFIGGGGYNTATGEGAVIGGGISNSATGSWTAIPGGYANSASGTYGFAAGVHASAAQTGTFVWSDGSDGDTTLTSSRAYQFLARASGGFTLYTNAGATVGAQLAAGSGSWASLSDRNAKTNIAPLNDDAILAKVDALPISRWSYKTEHGVRHVGPMAQDFYAAFKVGEDDRHITSIDEDGVALAAIKALHTENGALHSDNKTLHAHVATLDAENARLRQRLAADEAHERRVDADLSRISAAVQSVR